MIDFYEELAEVDLTGKIFGAFGSGDTFYEDKYWPIGGRPGPATWKNRRST